MPHSDPIITSLLDTDLYKLTMMQCVFHHFKETDIEYQLQIRKEINLSSLLNHIKEQCEHLCTLNFAENEMQYLRSLGYFKDDFLSFLKEFQLNIKALSIQADKQLNITIRGKWLNCILFEVPVLAIISECYTREHVTDDEYKIAHQHLTDKIKYLHDHAGKDFRFSDFGTRRRLSHHWQHQLVQRLSQEASPFFAGTSNVYFAQKYQLPVIGTMAHEYLQACQVLAPELEHCQSFALQTWLEEYQGELGIALTDTINMNAFLNDFPSALAKAYQGLRQDSGSPQTWAYQALKYYEQCGIDAKKKTLVFSDSLTIPKAIAIYNEFSDRAILAFGIGTNLTHDAELSPLDIVIKATECNGTALIKISDSPGKMIAKDPQRLQLIKQTFNLSEQ